MLLSIITINYNNAQGLKRTINSVENQSWQEFEWIVIDGGSTDGSRELIESISDKLSFWCSEPDNGIYDAMNKGIYRAKGKYLSFLNSGDVYYNEATLFNIFHESNHTEDILYGDSLKVYTDGHTALDYAPKKVNVLNMCFSTICQQGMFVSLEMLRAKPFDERFKVRGDSHRWLQAVLDGNSYKYLAMPTCRFYMDGISASGKSYENEDAMVRELIPSAIYPYLQKLYYYETYHPYVRFTNLLERGGLSEWIVKVFIKVMTLLFLGKKWIATNKNPKCDN